MNLIKFLKTYQADIILALTVILISITAFNLGKISIINKTKRPITITQPGTANELGTIDYTNNSEPKKLTPAGTYNPAPSSVVASKNSSGKLYHFLWCSGASKISDKNKITFTTETAAISAGYTLAGNCKK